MRPGYHSQCIIALIVIHGTASFVYISQYVPGKDGALQQELKRSPLVHLLEAWDVLSSYACKTPRRITRQLLKLRGFNSGKACMSLDKVHAGIRIPQDNPSISPVDISHHHCVLAVVGFSKPLTYLLSIHRFRYRRFTCLLGLSHYATLSSTFCLRIQLDYSTPRTCLRAGRTPPKIGLPGFTCPSCINLHT